MQGDYTDVMGVELDYTRPLECDVAIAGAGLDIADLQIGWRHGQKPTTIRGAVA